MEPMTIREIMDAVGGKLLGEFGDINRMVGRVAALCPQVFDMRCGVQDLKRSVLNLQFRK